MKPAPRIPRLLLTNDDGFDAPGLAILAEAAKEFCDEIWIVAPEHDQSGTGQSVTLNESLRCWPRGERRWAVAGTPADCVAMALFHFMADAKPSLILAGVNCGANVGDEVNLSGTLGAAFTGLMFGVPSMAISQEFSVRKDVRWDTARAITPKMLHHFLGKGWRKETCLSINIPDCEPQKITGFSWASQSRNNITGMQVDMREDHRDRLYYWLKFVRQAPVKDSNDYTILRRNEVAVMTLGLNRCVDIKEASVLFEEDAGAEADE